MTIRFGGVAEARLAKCQAGFCVLTQRVLSPADRERAQRREDFVGAEA